MGVTCDTKHAPTPNDTVRTIRIHEQKQSGEISLLKIDRPRSRRLLHTLHNGGTNSTLFIQSFSPQPFPSLDPFTALIILGGAPLESKSIWG